MPIPPPAGPFTGPFTGDVSEHLEQELAQDLQSYVKRGRGFAPAATAALDARWLALFREIAAGDATHERTRRDIEAELMLRGLDPPLDEAEVELTSLLARAEAVYRRVRTNRFVTPRQAALLAAFESVRRELETELGALLNLPL